MQYYKYEMHMHCSQCSKCGMSTSQEMVRAYHAAGYTGGVLTDHFIYGNTAVPRELPWEERMQRYYDAYLEALPVAKELDFHLLFGIEHAYGNCKEILIYGIDAEFLKRNPDIPTISVEEFGQRVHDAGGYITHAHPYRARWYIKEVVEPTVSMCDAIEVFNYTDPQEMNDKAQALADRLGLFASSGADAHEATFAGVGQAGLAFPYVIHTSEELVKALRNRDGKRIVYGEIIE